MEAETKHSSREKHGMDEKGKRLTRAELKKKGDLLQKQGQRRARTLGKNYYTIDKLQMQYIYGKIDEN